MPDPKIPNLRIPKETYCGPEDDASGYAAGDRGNNRIGRTMQARRANSLHEGRNESIDIKVPPTTKDDNHAVSNTPDKNKVLAEKGYVGNRMRMRR